MANGAHVVERVVRQQNVVAAIDSHPRSLGIVDDVVDEFDVVGFIMQPRRDHVFKPGALAGHIAPHSAIVDFVAFDADIGRAPFGVHTPVAGIVDDVALDVAILHCHKVNIVVISTTDVVVFEVDILRLVDFERFVGFTARAAIQGAVFDKEVIAPFAMYHVAPTGRDDGQIYQVQIGHIVYIEVAGDSGSTRAIGATDDDGELGSPAPVFPIIRHQRGIVRATHQHELIAGGEGGIGGDAVPDGTHAPFGTGATGTVVGIVASSGIHPNRL